ncbi:DNA methyltransferase [Helicobacter fennelliae]
MTQSVNNLKQFFTPKEASVWASAYLNKRVTNSNILYLINYGKVANYAINSKENLISKDELQAYYDTLYTQESHSHPLAFANYKEAETTKHIHRLHPYKGKFIPQLVEYFLDSHTDTLKTESYFKKDDIVLDIFAGSGTTLCVASELGMHSIGIDISCFNTMLVNAKLGRYDSNLLEKECYRLIQALESFYENNNIKTFEETLTQHLNAFNAEFFPKDFKRKVVLKEIDEKVYGEIKEREFLSIYDKLVKQFNIDLNVKNNGSFLDFWYIESIKQELILLKNKITKAPKDLQEILNIILSRTARSCRATMHADLATLKEPMLRSYYCKKHGRICKPLFSSLKWFKSYTKDTLKRIKEFETLRSNCFSLCLNADSCDVDIINETKKQNAIFANLLCSQKIAGIFSSPPYVGLIDYHEQHAYSYELFNLERKDTLEIGAKLKGQSRNAKENYTKAIAMALNNAKNFLKQDYNVFLVANDKFNLYPSIAEMAGMQIVKIYHRPVLNRSEKDTNAYSESIFHLKDKNEASD